MSEQLDPLEPDLPSEVDLCGAAFLGVGLDLCGVVTTVLWCAGGVPEPS